MSNVEHLRMLMKAKLIREYERVNWIAEILFAADQENTDLYKFVNAASAALYHSIKDIDPDWKKI